MSEELATKLRLLAQDIDEANYVIGRIEARRELARIDSSAVAIPTPLAIEPIPLETPDWALPDAAPLTHWQRWSLTYLWTGVAVFVLATLVTIVLGVQSLLTSLAGALEPYLAVLIGLPAIIALVVTLCALLGGRGKTFTFQGTGRLY
jgi:hypothetical protein